MFWTIILVNKKSVRKVLPFQILLNCFTKIKSLDISGCLTILLYHYKIIKNNILSTRLNMLSLQWIKMNKSSINFYKSLPHSNVCSSLRVFFPSIHVGIRGSQNTPAIMINHDSGDGFFFLARRSPTCCLNTATMGQPHSRGIGSSVRCQLLAQNPLNPLILTTASLFFRVLTRSFQMPSKLPFRPLSASATRCFAVRLTLKLETFASVQADID